MPPPEPKHVSSVSFFSEINFDTVPSGTLINNHYPGVTFTTIPVLSTIEPGRITGEVFASNELLQAAANSPPNVITINKPPFFAGFNEGAGVIRATFSSPQLYVSIDVLPKILEWRDGPLSPAALPYLSAFGQAIELKSPLTAIRPLLGTNLIPYGDNRDPQFEKNWQRIEFVSSSPTPDIYSVQFSSVWTDPGRPVLGLFDRLRFSPILPLPQKTIQIG